MSTLRKATRLHREWYETREQARTKRDIRSREAARNAWLAWNAFAVSMNRALARERGWCVAQTYFDPEQLLTSKRRRSNVSHFPVIDHSIGFRYRVRPFRPAAILSHTYANDAEVLEWAAQLGLRAERQPWSWYFPNYCTAWLFTTELQPEAHRGAVDVLGPAASGNRRLPHTGKKFPLVNR